MRLPSCLFFAWSATPVTRVLVEGVAPDALALARLLAAEGAHVRLLTDGPAPAGLSAVAAIPGDVDVAYLDVWTAETDQRVRALRAAGVKLSCLSDLLLERALIPTIGVTGTAGKSTTASFVAQLLRAVPSSGPVLASITARSGNLWATQESLTVLEARTGSHVIELTSSHLAFMHTSPHVAVVTCFWPDHLELHGTLEAYRDAKRQIVREQRAGDHLVLNADDDASLRFADGAAATVHHFSTKRPVERGAYVEDGVVIARSSTARIELGPVADGPTGQAVAAAVAAVLALGIAPERLVGVVGRLVAPSGRARAVGRVGDAVLIDDGMAATPAKTRATISRFGDRELVLVVGGELVAAGRSVHASPEERELLAAAVGEVARVSQRVVCFGPAGELLARELAGQEVEVGLVESPAQALAEGIAALGTATALVVSPMFPVSPAVRVELTKLLTRE